MKIIKKENGNVWLTDNSGNLIYNLPSSCMFKPQKNNTEIQFYFAEGPIDVQLDEITATQLEPAAEVPFDPSAAGAMQTILQSLGTDFFFDLADSGGGENPADEILKYTAQTVGAVTVDVADFAPEDGQMVSLEVIFQGRTTDGFQWFGKRYRSTTREGANVFFTTQSAPVTVTTIGTATDGNINVVGSLGLRLQVTGVAGRTTDWKITVKKYTINN